jgi:hypothetical protein
MHGICFDYELQIGLIKIPKTKISPDFILMLYKKTRISISNLQPKLFG